MEVGALDVSLLRALLPQICVTPRTRGSQDKPCCPAAEFPEVPQGVMLGPRDTAGVPVHLAAFRQEQGMAFASQVFLPGCGQCVPADAAWLSEP